MKDQMELLVEERAAMQAEIERLRGLLEAERNGNQTLQAEVTRSAYMVAEAKAQAEDWRRHHDSAVQRAEMAIERTRVLETDRLQREDTLRDAEARAHAAQTAANMDAAISWLKSFAEADREPDERNGVMWNEVPCEHVGKVIRHKRVQARMSLGDVCRVIGMPVIRLSAIERNTEPATEDEIRALLDAIPDISADDIEQPERVKRKVSTLPVRP